MFEAILLDHNSNAPSPCVLARNVDGVEDAPHVSTAFVSATFASVCAEFNERPTSPKTRITMFDEQQLPQVLRV